MITLKRAKAYQDRIAELENEIALKQEQLKPHSNNLLAIKHEALKKQLEEVKKKNAELSGEGNGSLKQAANELESLKKQLESSKEELAKLKAEAKTATEIAVDIVASQGIPMIKIDPDPSDRSPMPTDRQALIDLYRSRNIQNNIDMANRFNNNNNNKNRK